MNGGGHHVFRLQPKCGRGGCALLHACQTASVRPLFGGVTGQASPRMSRPLRSEKTPCLPHQRAVQHQQLMCGGCTCVQAMPKAFGPAFTRARARTHHNRTTTSFQYTANCSRTHTDAQRWCTASLSTFAHLRVFSFAWAFCRICTLSVVPASVSWVAFLFGKCETRVRCRIVNITRLGLAQGALGIVDIGLTTITTTANDRVGAGASMTRHHFVHSRRPHRLRRGKECEFGQPKSLGGIIGSNICLV